MQLSRIFYLAVLVLSLPFCAQAFDPLPPTFPYQQGWLGADNAYSILLDATNNRSVWLFGDTWVRNDSTLSRAGAHMVGNTVAIRTSDGVSQTINYYWQNQATASPEAFFAAPTNSFRYWPEDGFVFMGKLYICLTRIKNTGGGAFGFRTVGIDLVTIINPQDPPANWQMKYSPLYTSTNIFPGISTVVEGDYVYLFADEDDNAHKGNRPIYLTRIPLKLLDANAAASLEYLAEGDVWKPGPIGEDAAIVMDRGVTEMTIRWHPEINRWVAVQISNEFPAHHIWRRQADHLAGPWSSPEVIYTIPEYSRSNPNYKPGRFFYAGKEHIEFLNPANGHSLITYAGNSFSLSD